MSSTPASNWLDRFVLICKPEQSGKTFIMIQKIIKNISSPIVGKIIINIILCDNNLLLTKQTTERVKSELEEFYIDNEYYVEFSSHSRATCHNAMEVCGSITVKGIKNVLCCTNGTRMNDIYQIVDDFNSGDQKDKYHFKIWLDEADKFTGFIDDTLIPMTEKHDNVDVSMITATSKKLFDKYDAVSVLGIEQTTHPTLYHGWKDNTIRMIDLDAGCVGFATHVIENVCTEEMKSPGSKWFIPAESKQTTHNSIKKMCVKNGFAVFVVNGKGLSLSLPVTLEEIGPIKKTDELNTMMLQLYHEHHLERYPLAITGNLCIGRGISIMSNDFMLNYAILSSCHNKQEASQLSGRVKGNIKGFDNYKAPTVFTTGKFDRIATEWESKSRELAKLAFERAGDGEAIITKNEYKTLGEDYEYVCHDELFKSYAQAVKFLNKNKRKMDVSRITSSKKGAIHDVGSQKYQVSSKMLKPGQTVADLTENDRITTIDARHIIASRCISSTDKGSRYLILPVYETNDTAANKEKYQVRYINFKK